MADDSDLILADDENAFDTPLTTDPEEIRDQMVATTEEALPNWRPLDTAPEYQVMRAMAQVAADTNVALESRLQTLLLEFLGSAFGVPRLDGDSATSTISVTAVDTAGYTLPADETFYLGDTELLTVEDLVIPAGVDTATVGVRALVPGAEPNGADGELDGDAQAWFAANTPALVAPLADGTDSETDVAYSERLARELELLSIRPINPPDLVLFARRHPQVAGAWAIKGYDATTGETNKARTATVVAYTDQGVAPSNDVLAAILDDLVTRSVANANPRVVGPTLVPIAVAVTVVPYLGWDDGIVEDAVQGALEAALSPIQWALAPFQLDPAYVPSRIVHVNDLIAAVDGAPGVNRVTALTIGNGSSPQITLNSPVALPSPGALTITVGDPDA